ncbi:hypothetical protein [Aestuariivivens sp. NBU2969]|uniref:hypothetical protein n=1 Tax=Aestuariivivens sp. NBU2969 TaxID=2873267 RepID=UPI001CBBA152|nr:hypothetical protein [Aestuariivivens sp. NBU2969]
MKKISFLIVISILFSCSNNNDTDTEMRTTDLLKVSDIYLINSGRLTQNAGINFNPNELENDSYVQSLIESITQLPDSEFDEVCHIDYGSDGLVDSYKIGTNQIVSWRYDFGGTVQRDSDGKVISINDNPITLDNNKITFKQSDGWSSSNGHNEQINFSGNKLTKTFYINGSGSEISENSYTYQYSGDNFIKKHKTSGSFTFYEVSEYNNDEFYLPWIIHRSPKRLALEIVFDLRLMKKIPKKMINSQHSEQDVDITNIIKDELNRPSLILGRNSEYNTDYIVIYKYAD